MQKQSFEDLGLHKRILDALAKKGYETPTPVQQESIPYILEGRDLLSAAQTGTGKTAAFSLPILQQLNKRWAQRTGSVRALILTPTRELALQIDQCMKDYGCYLRSRTTVILGGVSISRQIKSLGRHPDILVATPGRLLDLVGKGHVDLSEVEMLVLDEADRMLDMGFIHDVKKIVSKTPESRQTMLFSATLTPSIRSLVSDMLRDPASVSVAPPSSVAPSIEQKVLFVEQTDKRKLLYNVLDDEAVERALVFARTKHRADALVRQLKKQGILAESIHSNKSQNARQRALSAFNNGKVRVLIGTDIVSRGIDVDGISHVINFELPEDPENYVHRIGRTARAGADGIALSFCNATEVTLLRNIEKLTKTSLTRIESHPFFSPMIASCHERSVEAANARSRPKRNRRARQNFRAGRRAVV